MYVTAGTIANAVAPLMPPESAWREWGPTGALVAVVALFLLYMWKQGTDVKTVVEAVQESHKGVVTVVNANTGAIAENSEVMRQAKGTLEQTGEVMKSSSELVRHLKAENDRQRAENQSYYREKLESIERSVIASKIR